MPKYSAPFLFLVLRVDSTVAARCILLSLGIAISGLVYAAPPIFVLNSLDADVSIIDAETYKVLRRIPTGKEPHHLYLRWFVTAANRLDHIDIYQWQPLENGFDLSLVKRIPTGKTPSYIAIDSQSTVAYVSLQDSNQLIGIDLHRQEPRWVGKLSVINTEKKAVIKQVRAGKSPHDVWTLHHAPTY